MMATGSPAKRRKDVPTTDQPGAVAQAKFPKNAGKINGAAARRLAHGADPKTLRTLALLDSGNFEGPAIAKAIGHPAGDVEAQLDTLRRARPVGVDKTEDARTPMSRWLDWSEASEADERKSRQASPSACRHDRRPRPLAPFG